MNFLYDVNDQIITANKKIFTKKILSVLSSETTRKTDFDTRYNTAELYYFCTFTDIIKWETLSSTHVWRST